MSKRKASSDIVDEQSQKIQNLVTYDDLWSACETGKIDVVKHAITQRLDLNKKHLSYHTPLYLACHSGQIEIVQLLLNSGMVDINKTNIACETALFAACSKNYANIVKVLLEDKTIDVNIPNGDDETPIHRACFNGNLEIAQELIKHGADADKPNCDGWTPLHTAILGDCLDIALELIKVVKDLDMSTNMSTTIFTSTPTHTPFDMICQKLPKCSIDQVGNCPDQSYLGVLKALVNRLPVANVLKKLHTKDDVVNAVLFQRISDVVWTPMKILLMGQKQEQSPLSLLHRDILQDISAVIKNKLVFEINK